MASSSYHKVHDVNVTDGPTNSNPSGHWNILYKTLNCVSDFNYDYSSILNQSDDVNSNKIETDKNRYVHNSNPWHNKCNNSLITQQRGTGYEERLSDLNGSLSSSSTNAGYVPQIGIPENHPRTLDFKERGLLPGQTVVDTHGGPYINTNKNRILLFRVLFGSVILLSSLSVYLLWFKPHYLTTQSPIISSLHSSTGGDGNHRFYRQDAHHHLRYVEVQPSHRSFVEHIAAWSFPSWSGGDPPPAPSASSDSGPAPPGPPAAASQVLTNQNVISSLSACGDNSWFGCGGDNQTAEADPPLSPPKPGSDREIPLVPAASLTEYTLGNSDVAINPSDMNSWVMPWASAEEKPLDSAKTKGKQIKPAGNEIKRGVDLEKREISFKADEKAREIGFYIDQNRRKEEFDIEQNTLRMANTVKKNAKTQISEAAAQLEGDTSPEEFFSSDAADVIGDSAAVEPSTINDQIVIHQ